MSAAQHTPGRIPAGVDYDVLDADSGEVLASVRHLWPAEPVDCCICGKPTHTLHAVPYYCGPVRSGQSEGGYQPACQPCYARWEKWDDALTEYDSWFAGAAIAKATGGAA